LRPLCEIELHEDFLAKGTARFTPSDWAEQQELDDVLFLEPRPAN
jgi:hypothetical protein